MQNQQFNYPQYFKDIKPKDELGIFNRFLFAFLSVHTTWESNIRAYEIMKGNPNWDPAEIENKLKESGVGLYNQRTRYISQFTHNYRKHSEWYLRRRTEKWKEYRNRLSKNILGLGLAKTSFAIEMIYPTSAWISCIDVHIARFCGENPIKLRNQNIYNRAENKIIDLSRKNKVLPTQFRWEYWDKLQGYNNPRYWSYCLESETNVKSDRKKISRNN